MSKWFGKIGYSLTRETSPGIWEPYIKEMSYYGDYISDTRRRTTAGEINDELNISSRISVLADPFAVENCAYMEYAEVAGFKWKISNVDIQYPRLIVTLGGVYNGE